VPPQLSTIRPFTSRLLPDFGELWLYRELVWTFAARDLRLRYRQTVLGVLWVVLQPIIAAGVFTVVFGKIAKLDDGDGRYFLLAFAGYAGFQVFQSTLAKAGASLLANAPVLTKVYFPRLVLPLSGILSTLVDLGIALLVFGGIALLKGVSIGWPVLLFPLWVLLALLLGLGAGLIVAAWSVRFRDVQHVLPIVLQLLVYATPVGYATAKVPAAFQPYLALNPLTGLMDGIRWSLLGMQAPSVGAVVWLCIASTLAVLAGLVVFTRFEQDLADVI
jgi:lipopolysaccharide transport system permease protein